MRELVTPKQVARAIGVSESSLKRWCDRGLIPTVRTAGGHRKLPISGVLTFLKQSGHPLVDPEVLGLPAATGTGERTLGKAKRRLLDALVAGDDAVSRQIVLDLFLAQNRLSAIFDSVVAPAFEEIGELWDCGDVAVYQERRACEICLRILHELRLAVPPPNPGSPVAIGGTLAHDNYTLATTMAELVLRENQWNASSLGTNLPTGTLQLAVETTSPQLVWVSVSHITDEQQFIADADQLYETVVEGGAAVVLGGRALDEGIRKQIRYSAFGDTMQHLESIAASLESHTAANETDSSA